MKVVCELIQLVIYKAVKDPELIFGLEKTDSRMLDRIDLLEMTLYNRETGTGRTKFDEMEEKMHSLNTKITGSIETIETKSDAFMERINNYLFDIDTKLVTMNTFEDKIQICTDTVTNCVNNSRDQIIDLREQIATNYTKTVTELRRIDEKLSNFIGVVEILPAKVKNCEDICKSASESMINIKFQM